jgi:hypothetical protein
MTEESISVRASRAGLQIGLDALQHARILRTGRAEVLGPQDLNLKGEEKSGELATLPAPKRERRWMLSAVGAD